MQKPRVNNEAAVPQRVIDSVIRERVTLDENGCTLSLHPKHGRKYRAANWTEDGQYYRVAVHRLAWIVANGRPVPDGEQVHHKCFNTACVNPDHLEAIPAFENARRQNGDDWPLGACKKGHSNEELRIKSDGTRTCWPCKQAADRRYYRATGAARRRTRKSDALS